MPIPVTHNQTLLIAETTFKEQRAVALYREPDPGLYLHHVAVLNVEADSGEPDIELLLTEEQTRILRDRLDAVLGETRFTAPEAFTQWS